MHGLFVFECFLRESFVFCGVVGGCSGIFSLSLIFPAVQYRRCEANMSEHEHMCRCNAMWSATLPMCSRIIGGAFLGGSDEIDL